MSHQEALDLFRNLILRNQGGLNWYGELTSGTYLAKKFHLPLFDPTPVTEEWVKSLKGFAADPFHHGSYRGIPDGDWCSTLPVEISIRFRPQGVFWSAFSDCNLWENPTRGEVRLMCKAHRLEIGES